MTDLSQLTPPEDMDDLDVAYSEVAKPPYWFRWQGQPWVVPHIRELDITLQNELSESNDGTLEWLNSFFRRAMGEVQGDKWAQVSRPGPMLEIFFQRWLKHSGTKPGEEQPSTDSSASTGESSRATSAGSTPSASRKRSTAKKAAPAKAASRRGNSST